LNLVWYRGIFDWKQILFYSSIYAQQCIYQENDMRELEKLFKVLSDESRLRALNLIQERECCVCEVMAVMKISQSKASRICSALYDVGIFKLRKQGRWALYSIDPGLKESYVNDILTGIKRALARNPAAQADLTRLKETGRLVPDCGPGDCFTNLINKDLSVSDRASAN
jgi:ArsR family transcriptional regulator, arsenate/arsenite/antimonite-responsive transcriptional repressor